jgi:malonyl-CoA O-methyltransferase
MVLRWPWQRSAEPQRLEPQAAYALWAGSYPPRAHNRLMEVEQAAVLSLLPDVRGLTALDAGCGSGRYLQALQDRGAVAIGIDLSSAMLEHAREVGSRIARADLCALPFDAMSLDLVVCGLALGDVAELELALAEVARILRPGGRVSYSVVHPAGAAAGWSRTFEANGRQCAIDGHWHSVEQHRHACAAARVSIDAWHEPVLHDAPAVLVVRAVR